MSKFEWFITRAGGQAAVVLDKVVRIERHASEDHLTIIYFGGGDNIIVDEDAANVVTRLSH